MNNERLKKSLENKKTRILKQIANLEAKREPLKNMLDLTLKQIALIAEHEGKAQDGQ